MSKKKPATEHAAEAKAKPAKRALSLGAAVGWVRASRLRMVISLIVAGAVIGCLCTAALVFQPEEEPSYVVRLANAFGEMEKGNAAAARKLAAKLLEDREVAYTEHGGAYYILGAVTLQDADAQLNPKKRQLLDLIAARYLEEARSRGLPAARETDGVWLLGRALHDAGKYERSIAILREALHLDAEHAPRAHRLLADSYLRTEPPKLAEALAHCRQFLATEGISPNELEAGKLLEGRILLAQRELSDAEQAIRDIPSTSAHYPEAVVLRGRILNQSLGEKAESAEAVAAIGQAQEQLRDLVGREGLPPAIPAQAQLLLGLLLRQLGESEAAVQQLDLVRRTYFGQGESLAATVHQAGMLLKDNAHEAAALYKRALSQVTSGDAAYDNEWISAGDFRERLSGAIDSLIAGGHFSDALELAEGLVAPFSEMVAVERQSQIHRAWAAQLELKASREGSGETDVTRAGARQHRREAGILTRKLADLRIATRFFLDDLALAADDLRKGHGFEQAAIVYGELLEQQPRQGEPEALVGLGESLLALGRTDKALETLEHCREKFPQHPATYKARLLASLALQETGKAADADTAKELLVDNLYRFSLAPESAEWRDSLFALGQAQFRRGVELECQSRLAGVDRAEAESRKAGLAVLEQSYAVFEEAIRTLSEAVERYPSAPQTLESRYRVAEAHRHSAKLPRKRLGAVTIETSRALLRRQMQDHLDAAIDGYSRLLSRVNDQQERKLEAAEANIVRNCYFGKADALFDSERYDEAIQAYSAATNRYQHDPESLEAYVQIASCHRRQGRISEARGTIEQARVVLQRLRTDAEFLRTTRLARQDWSNLLDWLRTL